MTFTGKSSNVSITINGTGEIIDVKFDVKDIDKDDIEMLQDMTMLAYNAAKKQLDNTTESKMGPLTKGMPGLF